MKKISSTIATILTLFFFLSDSSSGIGNQSDMIRFRALEFSTQTPYLEKIPTQFRLNEQEKSTSKYFLIQFKDTPLDEWKNSIIALGAELLWYIPENAFLVRLPHSSLPTIKSFPFVQWIDTQQPFFKVEPELLKVPYNGKPVDIFVRLYEGIDYSSIKEEFESLVSKVIKVSKGRYWNLIHAQIEYENLSQTLAALAKIDDIDWIERYPEYKLCNDDTIWVVQAGLDRGRITPIWDRGIHGEGQYGAVLDTGCDADMCFFYDNVLRQMPPFQEPPNYNLRKVVISQDILGTQNWDQHGHGTHTAGTVAGDNFAHLIGHDNGDGIAPGAKLVIQDAGSPSDVHPPDDMYGCYVRAYNCRARVHSNSWGWPTAGNIYHQHSMETDKMIWDYPDFLAVYAMGNEGPSQGTERPPSTAKNCVAVGATAHGSSANNMTSFSSHGPTADGRIKPDVTLCGEDINSAANDGIGNTFNCSTTTMSGTSMATPGVAGAALLVRQYYADGFYPFGFADPGSAFNPSAALVKATLINSADNMTGSYTDGPAPSFGQGWGRVNLDNALFFQEDGRDLYIDDNKIGISTGEEKVYHIAQISNTEPLEITLVWSDYPSTPSASKNLVNNLDLEVIYGMSSYKGNNYLQGQSVPGGSFDNKNNIECVRINTPEVGLYSIYVRGTAIPNGPQPYALVVTGDLGFSAGVISLDRGKYNCADTIKIMVSDYDLKNAGTQNIIISSTSEPAGETVTLNEIQPNSGVFEGTIQTTTSPPHSGKLLVAEGDQIVGLYIDADDGLGHTNVERRDTAITDCTIPLITSHSIGARTDTTASISVMTNEKTKVFINYGKTTQLGNTASSTQLANTHSVNISNLEMSTLYYFEIVAQDEAANVTVDNNNGQYYTFNTLTKVVIEYDNFDFPRGWTEAGDGQWERAVPRGLGGGLFGNPDPSEDHTGNGGKVWGTDLTEDGNYNNTSDCTLITRKFNCTGLSGITMSYWEWINTMGMIGGDATTTVDITNTGFFWKNIWTGSGLSSTSWSERVFDVSDIADNSPNFQVRFRLVANSWIGGNSGWNIDDFMLLGYRDDYILTPSPTPGTPTSTPTQTPTNTPIGWPTHTPTSTPTSSTTVTPTANPSHTATPTPSGPPNIPVISAEPPCTTGYSNTIYWSDESASGAVAYYAECALDNAFTIIHSSSDWISGTHFEFTGLSHNVTYYYRVRAKNARNMISGWSSPVFSMQDAVAPKILLGGYWDTRLYSSLGGTLTLVAFCTDNDIDRLQLLYQGNPTGIYLYDNGSGGDFAAGDNLFMIRFPIEGQLPPLRMLLTVEAVDCAGNRYEYPWIPFFE